MGSLMRGEAASQQVSESALGPHTEGATMKKKTSTKSHAKKKVSGLPPSALELIGPQINELLENNPDLTIGDLQALFASMIGPSPHDDLNDAEADARSEANLLALDAMEADSDIQARKLAKRALKLDPDCVDALLLLADLDARTPLELIEARKKAVSAGKRSLGERFIRENKGYFWGLLETRPYMRAMERLADMLRLTGIALDAIQLYEEMLELNPNDNQGIRYPLLGLYLETGDLKNAGRLLKKYKGDPSANMAWARVLLRFLSGDLEGATASLQMARYANRYVELYLTLRKELPREMPEMYELGSDEEAVLCLTYLSGAWAKQIEAGRWLVNQLFAESKTSHEKALRPSRRPRGEK